MRYVIFIGLLFLVLVHTHAETHPLFASANEQYNSGQYDSALVNFNQLIELYPNTKEYYFNRGLCFYKMQKAQQATADFDYCLLLDSAFANARVMKGLLKEDAGDMAGALREYEHVRGTDTINHLLNRRIKNYQLSVWISNNWYYMIALMLVVILLMAVVAKSISYKKW